MGALIFPFSLREACSAECKSHIPVRHMMHGYVHLFYFTKVLNAALAGGNLSQMICRSSEILAVPTFEFWYQSASAGSYPYCAYLVLLQLFEAALPSLSSK